MTSQTTFGEQLRDFLRAHSMTVEQFCVEIGEKSGGFVNVTAQTVNNWIADKYRPGKDQRKAAAAVLGVEVSELFPQD